MYASPSSTIMYVLYTYFSRSLQRNHHPFTGLMNRTTAGSSAPFGAQPSFSRSRGSPRRALCSSLFFSRSYVHSLQGHCLRESCASMMPVVAKKLRSLLHPKGSGVLVSGPPPPRATAPRLSAPLHIPGQLHQHVLFRHRGRSGWEVVAAGESTNLLSKGMHAQEGGRRLLV